MSPANLRHYVVCAYDYSLYQVVVLAEDRDAALAKAKAIYATDGFGNTDAFVHTDHDIQWDAFPLVGKVTQ